MWFAYCLIGFVVGVLVATICCTKKRRSIGNLRVDCSDDEPYLFLELNTSVGDILRRKTVTLDVKTEGFIPHK